MRRDVLTANVAKHPSFVDTPVFMFGWNGYIPPEGKADGTTYPQEYMELKASKLLEKDIAAEQALGYN